MHLHRSTSRLVVLVTAGAVLVSCTTGEREGELKTPFTIAGTITDSGTGLGLVDITVVFLGEGAPGSVTTGADGRYEQTGFFPGTVTVAPSGDYDFLYEDPVSGASRVAPVAIVIPEDAPDNTVQVDFTAMPTGASLDLLSPNGGEKLAAGGVTQIAWFATGLGAGRTVDLDYWDDLAQDWVPIASGVACADGANVYAWTLPGATLSPYFVRVACVELTAFTDQSDSSFEILPPGTIRSLALVAPNGGEQVMAGSALEVRWFATDLGGNTVTLEYWDDNLGQWVPIVSGAACADGTNVYLWTVPDADLAQCLVRVSCVELATFTDRSDTGFTVYRVATLRGRSEDTGMLPVPGVIYTIAAKAGTGSPEPPKSITLDVVPGVAEGGGALTLTDAERAGDPAQPDGTYVGATLEVLSGANAGEVRTVTAFSSATGTFTADLTFPFAFESSVEYEVADSGRFELSGFLPGTYVVTPSRTGFTFTPATQEIVITGSGVRDLPQVFVADSSAATLELLRPADGETLVVGTPFTIRWVESGLTGTGLKIEVDYGAGWQMETPAAPADGRQYSWTPTQGAGLARVRLTSNLLPTLVRESGPAGFEIVWHQTVSGSIITGLLHSSIAVRT